jgi:tetratricopeptide (TPR) repeat protein
MKALVSGQAGYAFLLEGDPVTSIHIDRPNQWTGCLPHEMPWILRNVTDTITFENASQQEIFKELEASWERDRAVHLALILLDSQEEEMTRKSASECLSEFSTIDFMSDLGNYFYAAPLPRNGDLDGAIRFARSAGASNLESFLVELRTDQSEILRRSEAWNALPDDLFDGQDDKELFRTAAAKAGAFRLFVTERYKSDIALFQMLASPQFRGSAKARRIFMAWAAPFKEKVANVSFIDDEQSDTTYWQEEDVRAHGKNIGGRQVYLNVEKQKEGVKSLLAEGRRSLAFKYIRELIESQRPRSKPEHISKSLCDLAQYCKRLGDARLQLWLSEWAAKEMPTDGWPYAQMGDAYRALSEFSKALAAYQRAGSLGHRAIALCGRAAVLRELGEFHEALEIFEACIKEFPYEAAARAGRAEVIKELGRLPEALTVYEQIIKDFPNEVVPQNGWANLLRDLGRLDESLAAHDDILGNYPDDLVALNSRAEVLREAGFLERALDEFQHICKRFPLDVVAHLGKANVLKDMGNFEEALAAYNEVAKRFRMYPAGYNGRASILKKQNRLVEALTAYSENFRRFPRSMSARIGLASVLAALERYEETLNLLPVQQPATFNEWLSFHIRAVTLLRKGDVDEAVKLLERGIAENPWPNQKPYFETALAGARIRKSEHLRAVQLLEREFHPVLKPVATVLQLHAYGELSNREKAKAAFDSIQTKCPAFLVESRDALGVRFGFINDSRDTKPNDWIFEHECNSLLLAA